MPHVLKLASLLATLALAGGQCAGQSYPVKPVRILISSAPGGPVDIGMRGMNEALRQDLGQPIIIENQGAADGIVAAQTLARAGTPRDIIERWNRTLSKVLSDKSYVQKVLEPQGFEAAPPSGEPVEAFAQFLVRDKALYVRIRNEAKLKTGE